MLYWESVCPEISVVSEENILAAGKILGILF